MTLFSFKKNNKNISEAERASRAYRAMHAGEKKKMMNRVIRNAAEEQAELIKKVNAHNK